MSQQDPPLDSGKRTLSEIGHLFLSDVRDRHTGGAPGPRRVPPIKPLEPAPTVSAPAKPALSAPALHADDDADVTAPVTVVLAAHLAGAQDEAVRQYARGLASHAGTVGLIELSADRLRLSRFERADASGGTDQAVRPPAMPSGDLDELADAIAELNCDVDRWLLVVASPRSSDARLLLTLADAWTLLSTCDHDGVVSSYRLLKGLAETTQPPRPALSLMLLDGADDAERERVHEKLAGVCAQFLHWPLRREPAARASAEAAEHALLEFQAELETDNPRGHWELVRDLLDRQFSPADRQVAPDDAAAPLPAPDPTSAPLPAPASTAAIPAPRPANRPASPTSAPPDRAPVAAGPAPASHAAMPASRAAIADEVLDLNCPDASADAILSAVLHRRDGELIECPVRAPMCACARLAIGRDRRIVLLAVAREGLGELKAIGQAFRWLSENRVLIGMAVPQFAFNPEQSPRLRLLVDQSDASAELLRPLMQSGDVTVEAYRTIRWGGRTGLLLDAA